MVVKICGIRTVEAAMAAAECGVDYIGFVFAPVRRKITRETARQIGKAVRGVKKVGVFLNEDLTLVNDIAAYCGLDYVQLHGGEPPEYGRLVIAPVIKAFNYRADLTAAVINDYPAEFALIDSGTAARPGGTGQSFDWLAAQPLTAAVGKRLFVAGGINSCNVAAAAEALRPYGIDVSGGVEGNDGEKSTVKIAEFMAAVAAVKERYYAG